MSCYCDHFAGNVNIQNIFTKTRYQEVLQKKLIKDEKIRPITYHLNEIF